MAKDGARGPLKNIDAYVQELCKYSANFSKFG